MKKFFKEFKTFITRGNVLDMAVGVIVGGAFTGIVNGLSNYILKPIINWLLAVILGKDGLTGAVTILGEPVLDANGAIDLANSNYIDWGAFISSIINFLLIAFVLFTIVKIINKFRADNEGLFDKISKKFLTKAERKELKARGLKLNRKNIEAYLLEKAEKEKEAQKIKEEEAKRKAEEDRKNNPTVEDLLKDIKALLSEKSK